MSRDYVKRSSNRKKSKKSFVYPWLVILLLIAAFVAGMIANSKDPKFISDLVKTMKLEQKAKEKKITVTKTQPSSAITTKTIPTPKFNFYNTMPQKKPGKMETEYELEIAIAKDFAAADHLKAELALLGFAASITPIHNQGGQKYCVSIGPYGNKETAGIDQQKLKQNKIGSTLHLIKQ